MVYLYISKHILLIHSLLCQREQLQSIVMSMFVCLSVCLRGCLQNHMRHHYQIVCACCLRPWLDPPLACWRQAALPIGRNGVTGVHSVGEVYDCLVSFFALWPRGCFVTSKLPAHGWGLLTTCHQGSTCRVFLQRSIEKIWIFAAPIPTLFTNKAIVDYTSPALCTPITPSRR